MKIIITGTPGTGKSSTAKELAQILGIELVDVKKIGSGIKSRSGEVEIQKLRKLLMKELKGKRDFIAENHLLCEFSLPADFVFVLRVRPDVLLERLIGRAYGKKKIDENLVAEMLDYCTQKVNEEYGVKPIEIETSGKTALATASRIARIVRNKKLKGDKVDYGKYLVEYTKDLKK